MTVAPGKLSDYQNKIRSLTKYPKLARGEKPNAVSATSVYVDASRVKQSGYFSFKLLSSLSNSAMS